MIETVLTVYLESFQLCADLLLLDSIYVKLGGYTRVRTFTSVPTTIGTTDLLCRNLSAVFWNGGPETLAWGCLVVVIGALAQAASLAEMASIQPIAGAQYHWTHFLAPPRQRRFITWMQGQFF